MDFSTREKTPKAFGKREMVWIGIGNVFLMVLVFSVGFWIGKNGSLKTDRGSLETPEIGTLAPPIPPAGEEAPAMTHYSFYKTLDQKKGELLPLETEGPREDPLSKGLIFTVQVGAYQDQRAAENLKNSLKSKNYSVYLEENSFSGTSKIYRVRVGKYKEREKAQALAIQLEKEERLPTFVTLVNP